MTTTAEPHRSRFPFHAMAAIVCLALIVMPWLKYAGLRTLFFDTGQYITLFNISRNVDALVPALSTHTQAFLPVYATLLQGLPTPYGMLFVQSLACILGFHALKSAIADRDLTPLVFAVYFGALSVWFTALNEFHFEHLIFGLYFLFIRALFSPSPYRDLMLVGSAALICLVKEVYALSALMMGVMLLFHGRHRAGALIILLSGSYFLLATQVLIPAFTEGQDVGELWQSAFGHLGDTPLDMAKTILLNPGALLTSGLISPRKLLFVAVMAAPFAYTLWRAPSAWLPALPSFGVMFLSNNENHAYLGHHYTVMVTAVAMGAMALSLKGLDLSARKRLLTISAALSGLMLVLFGPAPLASRLFWAGHAWGFQASAYLPDARSREIARLIETHVPADGTLVVSVQNSINHTRIADRPVVLPYPLGVAEPGRVLSSVATRVFPAVSGSPNAALAPKGLALADIVVVDLKRPLSLKDAGCRWTADKICDDPAFLARFERTLSPLATGFDRLASHDGFAIYRRRP